MKIKNVSVKVIGILGHDLMPDEAMECNQFIVKNPAVDTLVKMGFLVVDDSEEKANAIKEAAMREAREQLLKEQEEAAAKEAAAKEAAAKEAADATGKKTDGIDGDAEASAAPKRTRRVTKPVEPAAELAAE